MSRVASSLASLLSRELVGGALLLGAAIVGIAWANSPVAASYLALRDQSVLGLTVGTWSSDGLLAVFFFLVGLELKQELTLGRLRRLDRAVVPVAAAAGGVVVPAAIYLVVNGSGPDAAGWAIPAATDIAFAVAVLAIVGRGLPSALRLFLLTLAVVDDLIAIGIIAVAYTESINALALGLTFLPVAAYAVLTQQFQGWFGARPWAQWLVLLPIGVAGWALLHESGIHATIAGVVLGLVIPVRGGLSHALEVAVRPISTALCLPIFALFAAGVPVGGLDGLAAAITHPVALGVAVGLVVGKPVGIVAATFVATRLTRASLDDDITWIDLAGVGGLAGIGFTVSLLIGDLSFDVGGTENAAAKVGILAASLVAAGVGGSVLAVRSRAARARSAAPAALPQ